MAARHMGHRPEEKHEQTDDRIELGSVITIGSRGLGMMAPPVHVH
jgi:hypothetical protein